MPAGGRRIHGANTSRFPVAATALVEQHQCLIAGIENSLISTRAEIDKRFHMHLAVVDFLDDDDLATLVMVVE